MIFELYEFSIYLRFLSSKMGIRAMGDATLQNIVNISEVAWLCPTLCDHMDCSLVGYSPCDHKESDTTKQLH